MNIAKILYNLRKELNLSQKELAERVGVSQSTIAKIEIRRNEATASTIRKLALYFNVSTDYLLGLDDDFGVKIDNNAGTLSNNEIHVLNEYRKLLPAYKDLIKKQLELFNEEETQIIKR